MFEENKNRGIFVVAVFEHEKEQLMKEYLLKPHKRLQILTNNGGEIFLLQGENGLRGISPLISDKYFVFIHFKYDTDTFLRAFVKENYSNSDRITNEDIYTFNEKSDIQISFGFRKSPLTSIHTILKSYGLEQIAMELRNQRRKEALGKQVSPKNSINLSKKRVTSPGKNVSSARKDECNLYTKLIKDRIGCEINGINQSDLNCIAIQLKLELYMSEFHWKNSNTLLNRQMLTFINIVEARLS